MVIHRFSSLCFIFVNIGNQHPIDQFIYNFKTVPSCGIQGLLDVNSLFTNIPVGDTAEFILDKAFNHMNLPLPPALKDIMRDLSLFVRLKPYSCIQIGIFKSQ